MTTEDRYALLESWLASVLPGSEFGLAPASSDASFRRYFRLTLAREAHGARTLIAMDAPPPMEDCRPFVHVAALLADAGVHAPRVLAQDLGRGFLLLTDLGTTTYLDALDRGRPQGGTAGTTPDRADALYLDAIDALVRWQAASREGELPPYDEALLRRELDLFPDWYLAKHLGLVATHHRLLAEVWGPTHVADTHYLRLYMKQLRAKLEADSVRPRYLLTETGVGYRLVTDD